MMRKSISVTRIDEIDEQVVKIDKSWVLMRQAVYNKFIRTLTLFTNAGERELIDGKFYAIRTREVATYEVNPAVLDMYEEVANILIPDLRSANMPANEKHRQLVLRLSDIVESYNATKNT